MVYGKVAVGCKRLAVTTQNSGVVVDKKRALCSDKAPVECKGFAALRLVAS
ncbi:hypothetical protein ES705_45298 [subsurface metagenome]